jgi:hypothetical protein
MAASPFAGIGPGATVSAADNSAFALYGTPVIDGAEDDIWSDSYNIHLPSASSIPNTSADIKVMWDDEKLYVLAEVADDTPHVEDTSNPQSLGERNDCIDLWINWNARTDAGYGYSPTSGDPRYSTQYTVCRNNFVGTYTPVAGDIASLVSQTVDSGDGYVVEASIAWPKSCTPIEGNEISINFSVNDDIDGVIDTNRNPPQPRREGYLTWDTATSYWSDPSRMPRMELSSANDGRIFKKADEVSVAVGESVELPIWMSYKGALGGVSYSVVSDLSSGSADTMDSSVASLDIANSRIAGVSQGTAVITARKSGLNVDRLTVHVTDSGGAALSIGSLPSVDSNLEVGDTRQLTATNTTGGQTSWHSSNTAVATVDANGIITAVGAGSAYVYARAPLGGTYLQDRVKITVWGEGNRIPFRYRLVGAESATVGAPFLVNVHFDTATANQAVNSIESVISYDPDVLEFSDYRPSGAAYTDNAAKGELKAVWSFGGSGRTNYNVGELDTTSRIGTFCFVLKSDAPKDTVRTALTVKSVAVRADGLPSSAFDITQRGLEIKTAFDPASDANGDGLVSVGDVAKSADAAAVAADSQFGFYPVKRIIYLGIDGGGNFMTPESYIETGHAGSAYTYKTKTADDDPKYHFDMFEGEGGLAETGSYTWNATTSDPPVSAQNWTAMFFGFEPADNPQYGIRNEDAAVKYYPIEALPYKSIFNLLRKAQPNRLQSTIIEWTAMENGIVDNNLGAYQVRGTSEGNIDTAISMIADGKLLDSSFTFIDTDRLMDGIGHGNGWYNDNYYTEGRKLADKIEQLVDAIDSNEGIKDDTVFMIGNDHGGYGPDHGSWNPSDYYMMMYSRGPIIKSGFKYNGDNGTLGNRGDEDARQKDWPALFAKAMNIEACPAWVGTADNHDIFLPQSQVSSKNRAVEEVSLVKLDNGYTAELSDIQSANRSDIKAAHLILSGTVNASALVAKQGAKILKTFVKGGKTNVILKTGGGYAAGGILDIKATQAITLENAMLAKSSGREIYPDLSAATRRGVLDGTEKANTATDTAIDISAQGVAVKIADKEWTGKQIKTGFAVTVSGAALKAGADYDIKSVGANKNIGKGSVTIAGKGKYKGTRTVEFKVIPKKLTAAKLKPGKNRTLNVTWKKAAKAQKIKGYQIHYRVKPTRSATANWKSKTASAKAAKLTLKALKKGKIYQVRIRSYAVVGGSKYYAPWSAVKTSGKVK